MIKGGMKMIRTMSKALALILACSMAFSLAACGDSGSQAAETTAAAGETAAAEESAAGEEGEEASAGAEEAEAPVDGTQTAAEYFAANFNPDTWTDESDAIYPEVLGEFEEEYRQALEAENLSERYALMAVAEAKLLESAVMIPLSTRGGRYTISRVVPYSGNTTLWGNDSDRQHYIMVTTEPITPADRDEMKAKWAELKGTGTYRDWAKEFLAGKGYELKDNYNYIYTADPTTWDVLATSQQADSEPIVQTYDGLVEYDSEQQLQPALAESYTVSEDGLTYTFKIREGAVWVDSQGRKVADVVADDFVAGMQHMMDAMGGLEYLVGPEGANIKGAQAYIDQETQDFATVGVKAVDDHTLEYTLEAPCSFFTTMLSYGVFAPMSRAYYESQGGKFGQDFSADDPNYQYGADPDHIAYCGPYLVTNATEKNTIVFKKNDSYWNADNMELNTITWLYNDGTEATKQYTDTMAGTVDGAGLNDACITAAKSDGNFDKYAYISATDATSYMGFFNINRKAFANSNDNTVAVSEQTVADAERTHAAMMNLHFRRALLTSLDRASYNAQSEGEDLKLNSLRNSYTPGTFVSLPEDVSVDINGTATTFAAGTFFGEIVQAQIDADGLPVKVWDPEGDGGVGSSDGFDGWYNKEYAASEIAAAAEELAADGVTVSAEEPIQIDLPYFSGSEIYTNRANVFKQSLEDALGGMVQVNLIKCESQDDWLYSGYYTSAGYEQNCDVSDVSGWGPDYGDPQTYLSTMLPNYSGYMTKTLGLY